MQREEKWDPFLMATRAPARTATAAPATGPDHPLAQREHRFLTLKHESTTPRRAEDSFCPSHVDGTCTLVQQSTGARGRNTTRRTVQDCPRAPLLTNELTHRHFTASRCIILTTRASVSNLELEPNHTHTNLSTAETRAGIVIREYYQL